MAQDPKTAVQRLLDEVWNNRNPAAAGELLADDFVWHHPTLGDRRGREGAIDLIAAMREAFPDMEVTLEAIVAEGDTVMSYWKATGTHGAPYQGVAPASSGQKVTWGGTALDRVVDGRIVERRTFLDSLTPGSPHEIASR